MSLGAIFFEVKAGGARLAALTVSMTQKSAKKKSKKRAKSGADESVLGSLRSTRPTRLGRERRTAAATSAKPSATKAKAAKPKATKKAAPKKRAAKKAPATAAQPKATAAQRPSAPPPPPPPRSADGRPSGAEIVTTAVQATGELARIGVTVGGQLLRRAAQRIPRP